MHVRQIHSWRLVRDDRGNTDSVEVIVAHALKNYRNAGKGIERLVQSVHEKLPSSGRIRVFTCDVDDVIIRGEKGFDAAYQVFLDVMAEALVKIGSTRQMLFICHDIASWLVIRFLAEYLPKHLEYSQRVAGAILLGIDAPAWDANFRHKDQLEGWRERIVERLRNNSNIIERKKYKRVPPANELSVRLRWLEACFIDSTRNSPEVKRIRERIFALPLTKDARVSEIPPMENPRRSSSTLFNMNLGKEPPPPTEYDMRLDQLSQPLLDIIRYLENDHPDTDKVHFSQACQYFRSMLAIPDNGDKTGTDKAEKEEKAEKAGPDTIQRKFRGPESVQPPPTLSPLRFEESTPHTIPIPILRSSPPPPSPQSDWEDSFRRAQDYFLRCELHDADILYDECGNAVNQDLFAGTDIPLRSMFQRAVILIMKGKYDRARNRLERIEEECDEWIRILDKESQGMRVTFNHAVSAEPMGPPPKRVSDLGGVSSTRVRWTREKDDLFRNLKVLRQRAGFQIAVTFTRQGDLSKASDLVVALHKLYEGLREQLFAGEIESVQSQAGVAGPQLKLVVAVSRLLGLINGYLGRYNKAGALLDEAERICHAVQNNKAPEKSRPGLPASTHDIESLPPTTYGYGLEAAEEGIDTVDTILAAVKLSKAKVLMMRGLYKEGLVTIEEALQTMEEVLGLSHLLSLEARYIKSMLLALSCRLRHAHAFSQETIKIMNKHVSREHPLSLEMTNTLVTIYKLQARPLEALSICQTLSTIAKRTLGARNQQTLRYMFQEASLNRWIGNYEDAKSLLQAIRMEAKEKWEQTHQLDQHPWTMQCVAELAYSYALTGDYTSAEEAISHVLQSQRVLYGPTEMNQSTDSNNAKGLRAEQGKELKTIVSELVAEIPRWRSYSSAISDQKSSEPATLSSILGSGGPHHDLLTTLEIWAKIEISRPDADRSLVIVVQRLVYDCRKASCGPDHATTLNAAVDIANTLREDSIPEHVEAAAKYYSEITIDKNDCRDWLDTEHPLKLAARQGEALVKMHTGLQEFEGLEEIASYFGSIAEQQTLRLGRQHPETLRSLLTTFVVVSLLDNEKGIKISNDIRERLRAQNVRKQRRQESVLLRERLGFLHYVRANIEQALQIFSELVHELKIGDLPADSDGLYDRNDIERRIRQQEKVVRDAAKETYEETVAEARAEEGKRFHHDAEPKYYSAWNLAIVLYGRDSSEAEMIQYEWARSLWNCGGSCRRRSTPGIVDERPPHEPVDPAQHQMAAFSVVKSLALGKSHDDVFALTLRQTLEQWSHELGMLETVEKADQATPKHRSSESEER